MLQSDRRSHFLKTQKSVSQGAEAAKKLVQNWPSVSAAQWREGVSRGAPVEGARWGDALRAELPLPAPTDCLTFVPGTTSLRVYYCDLRA